MYQGPKSSGAWSQGARGTARSRKDTWRQHDEEQRDRRDQEQQAKVGHKRRAPSPSQSPPDTKSAASAAGNTLPKREARDGARDGPPPPQASRRASGVSDEVGLRCAKCGSTDTQRWGWGGEMLCEACCLVPSTPRAPPARQWRVSDRVHARHGSTLNVGLDRSSKFAWIAAAYAAAHSSRGSLAGSRLPSGGREGSPLRVGADERPLRRSAVCPTSLTLLPLTIQVRRPATRTGPHQVVPWHHQRRSRRRHLRRRLRRR